MRTRVFRISIYKLLNISPNSTSIATTEQRQHIATPDVPAYLLAHPEWSTRPVNGKPFSWNPETGELAVNTLGEHPKGQRFGLMLR
jgi:hypothetical protein